MKTLDSVASEFAGYFETHKRTNGEEYVTIEDAPAWAHDIVMSAHDGMMPNDWSYSLIRSVALAIDERLGYDLNSDLDDCRHELIDGIIPVYNAERVNWLASNLNRGWYVNEAVGEFGTPEDFDIYQVIAYGIDVELNMIFQVVLDGLLAQVNEPDDDGEGA